MLWFYQILLEPRILIPIRIFWAVSVPLAIILIVFFFSSWPGKIRDRLKIRLQRSEESPLPAYMRRLTPVGASGSMLKRLRGRKDRNNRGMPDPLSLGAV